MKIAGFGGAAISVSTLLTQLGSMRSFGSEQKPNRFTRIYNEMQVTCPEQIELYAKCVVAAHQSKDEGGASTHNACAEEFRALKECFRKVRRRQQQ